MIIIKKGEVTIEATNDCEVEVDGNRIRISPKTFHVDVTGHEKPGETVRAMGELLKLREPKRALA